MEYNDKRALRIEMLIRILVILGVTIFLYFFIIMLVNIN